MPALSVVTRRLFTRTALAFMCFCLCAIGFIALADEIHESSTTEFDDSILRYINSFASPAGDTVFVWLTHLGGILFMPLITAAFCAFFWRNGNKEKAAILAVAVSGAALLNVLVKQLFERSRPELWEQLVTEHSFSFPSGHAMISSALAFALILLFWSTAYRAYAIILGSIYMFTIGFSRLYLGVHYPTDIIGGWLLSLAWVSVVWFVWKSKHQMNPISSAGLRAKK